MLSTNRVGSTVRPIQQQDENEITFEQQISPSERIRRRYFDTDNSDFLSRTQAYRRLSGRNIDTEEETNYIEEVEKEKFKPTETTMMYVDSTVKRSAPRVAENVETRTSSVAKTKVKIAVAAYVAVILALAIAIAFTALNVSGLFSQTANLSKTAAEQMEIAAKMAEELSVLDEAALTQAALKLGYQLPDTTNTIMYELPKTRTQNFEVTTNWFDKLCDALCNIFGGN